MDKLSTPAERHEHFRQLQRRSAKERSVRKVEEHIRRLVEQAPPLSPARRDALARLLRPTA